MPDREKVIKGLEICKNPHGRCAECPYDDGKIDFTNCTSILCGDALALLKEQKDKLDHIVEFKKGDVVQTFSCYFCHTQYRAVLKGHETIHCKECEHYTPHGSSGICGSWGEWCDPDEWCSRAVLLTEVRRYDNQ